MMKSSASSRITSPPARRWSSATRYSSSPAMASTRATSTSPSQRSELHGRGQEDRQGDVDEQRSRAGQIMHGQWSNPSYAEPNGKPMVIFPGGDGWIRAFDPRHGELIWKFDCNPKKSVYKLGPEGTRSDFVATPVIYETRSTSASARIPNTTRASAICGASTSARRRRTRIRTCRRSTTISIRRRRRTRIPDWSGTTAATLRQDATATFTSAARISTCCVHDGLAYAAEFAGFVHCLDAKTGQSLLGARPEGRTPGVRRFWVDGKIYMGNDSGKISIFKRARRKRCLASSDGARAAATCVRRRWSATARCTS